MGQRIQSDSNIDVLIIWQSLVVSAYRNFFAILKKTLSCRLALALPRFAYEAGSQKVKCEPFTPEQSRSFDHIFVAPTLFFHTQIILMFGLSRFGRFFFGKASVKKRKRIILCMAEPYSITAFWVYTIFKFALFEEPIFILYSFQNIFKENSWLLRRIQNYLFKHVNAIMVPGQEQIEVLRRHGFQGKTIDFPLWFDPQKFYFNIDQPNALPDTIHIGFAGNISEAKGISDFLKVAERFISEPGIRISIVGTGPAVPLVNAKVEELQKFMKIIYCGPLKTNVIPEFFRDLDFLIVPSRTTENWKEQFGRVIIEAKACGCAVLGSNSGEIPHVINDPKMIFQEGDINQIEVILRREIAQYRSKEDRLKAKREFAQQALEQYSDQKIATKLAAQLITF